jgi:hypothetical protein
VIWGIIGGYGKPALPNWTCFWIPALIPAFAGTGIENGEELSVGMVGMDDEELTGFDYQTSCIISFFHSDNCVSDIRQLWSHPKFA